MDLTMPKAVLIVPVAMALLTGFCVYLDHEEKLLKESQEHELRMLLEREKAVLKGFQECLDSGKKTCRMERRGDERCVCFGD